MKAKAFTLVEILVVLIISSIILYAAYFAFMNINLYQKNLARALNKKSDIIALHSLLTKDFDQAEIINMAVSGEVKFNYTDPKFSVTYIFTEDNVIRSVFSTNDTLSIATNIIEYSSHREFPVIESLRLQADDFTWFFSKHYSGSTLNDLHNGKRY